MLEETSKVHLVQPLCSNKVAQSQLPKTMSRQLLNISKDVESTTSLGNICQSLEWKNILVLRGNLLCLSLWPLPLVLSLNTTEKSLLYPPR